MLFSSGLGLSIQSILKYDDADLVQLAAELPHVLVSDKAHNTNKRHFSAFKKWEAWAKSKSVAILPASPNYFALFLVHLIDSVNSVSTFDVVIHGVSWANAKFGLQSPTGTIIKKQIIQTAHRQLGKTTMDRKLPLERSHILQLHDKFAQASLDRLQILTLITLGFVAFLHWDDLSRLRCYDIKFHNDHMAIFLEKGKNDQFRERSWIFVAASTSKYCPVLLLKKFLSRGVHFSNSYLFRKVSHTSSGYRLRIQRLTYSYALQLVRKQLKAIYLDPKHSMRSVGASLAASLGVPDRLIIRQGGWRSVSSKK